MEAIDAYRQDDEVSLMTEVHDEELKEEHHAEPHHLDTVSALTIDETTLAGYVITELELYPKLSQLNPNFTPQWFVLRDK